MSGDSTFLSMVDEGARRRFEAAWRAGTPRPIEEFLPPADDECYAGTLEELVQIEMEMLWKTRQSREGPAPRVEKYLDRFPILRQPQAALRLLKQEFRVRRDWGDRPDGDEYRQRFPDLLTSGVEFLDTMPPVAPAQMATLPAPVDLPNYEFLGHLGRGGMGVVYKARQVSLNRLVALKMISAGAHASSEELARFRAEAEAVAHLQHPNIVQIHEIGAHNGRPFFSLEFVEGGSLDKALAGVPQPALLVARLLETVARAVHFAHQRGIIHRDLKPANILLDYRLGSGGLPNPADSTLNDISGEKLTPFLERANPKITDFGLAKRLQSPSGHTQSGNILGTPSYMAPEQAAGQLSAIGPATDVYALGAILYEMLTGRPPFRAAAAMDTIFQVLHEEPIPPRRLQSKVPADLQTICLKCLEKNHAKRYASALALAEDLRRYHDDEPILARPAGRLEKALKWARRKPATAAVLAISSLAALLLLGLGIGFTQRLQEESVKLSAEGHKTKKALDDLQGALQKVQEEAKAREEANAAKNAENLARLAEQKKREEALQAVVRLVQTSLYAKNMGLAYRAYQQFELTKALSILNECPEPARGWEWHYVHNLCLRKSSAYGEAETLAFSGAGRLVALAGKNKVQVVDAKTGQARLVIETTCLRINSVSLNADGTQVAFDRSGAWNSEQKNYSSNQVMVYDTGTGKNLFTLEGHTRAISYVTFSPDGALLVSAGDDHSLRLWDPRSGKHLATLTEHKGPVRGLAFDRAGRLASADEDGLVLLWDLDKREKTQSLQALPKSTRCLAFAPDGKQLATGGADRIVRIWDLKTEQAVRLLYGHQNEITSITYDPTGEELASAGSEGVVKLWKTALGQELLTFPELRATRVQFGSDGKWLGCAGRQAVGIDLSVASDYQAFPLSGRARSLALHPLNKEVVVGSGKSKAGLVQVLDASTGAPARTSPGHLEAVGCAAFNRAGDMLATGAFTIRLEDFATGKLLKTFPGHGGRLVNALAFSADGRHVVSGGSDNLVKIWDVAGGRLKHSLAVHKKAVHAVCVSPDGNLLASAGYDQKVHVWKLASSASAAGERLLSDEVPALVFDVGTLALDAVFHPDGRRLAVLAGGEVVLLDVVDGKELGRFRAHKTGEALAFTPDGRRIVTCTGWGEKAIRIWDTDTGQEVLMLEPRQDFPDKISFSRDGLRLFVAGVRRDDQKKVRDQPVIHVWDATPLGVPAPAEPVVVDHQDKKLRGFMNLYLAVHNKSAQKVTLHVRFMTRDAGKDTWFPAGEVFEQYTLLPGEKKDLLYMGRRVEARRIRYWAQTEKGEVVADSRTQDFSLLPKGGDLYIAPEMQSYTLILPAPNSGK